ncbi:MAG TPA: MmcQ/YjbR family DNA-binding protein [Saprospiraceae bacterium]|nr:MmcQ/YjbR family DNA-binding protein [Saprospiraceae bacterium]
MTQIDRIRNFALSFPKATEETHFDKTSFRVKKKIFATFDAKTNKLCLKLSEIEQDIFSLINRQVIYPVPNQWGKKGWTLIELDKLDNEILLDALRKAYCTVAPKSLVIEILTDENGT